MAPKKVTAEVADTEASVPLQAVVLADSFAQSFRPITLDRPKALLPLVNVPMIDYTMEWLATAGVEEIYVFCCAHSGQVKAHLDRYWPSQPGLKVRALVAHDCVSAGDALRFIDQKGSIRSDFVLVSGDVVSNMSLTKVLAEHRERKKADKNAIMTSVVRRSKPHPVTRQTRLGGGESVYGVNPATGQLVHVDYGRDFASRDYKEGSQRSGSMRQVALDKALFDEHQAIQLRSDLQDCHIDICAPEVLMLFTDNFDYQHLRRDFVKGLLGDEVLGNKIYLHELTREYAAQIDSLRAYDVASQDIVSRWVFPLGPEVCFGARTCDMRPGRGNKYVDQGVTLARTAEVSENTVLGAGTTVGENTVIRGSVIGRNCTIGRNVVIDGCYLWSGVTVGDRAELAHSLLCDGATVRSKAVVEAGSVLSFKVVIGDEFRVAAYSKVSLHKQPTEEDSSDEELEYADSRPASPAHTDEGEEEEEEGADRRGAFNAWEGEGHAEDSSPSSRHGAADGGVGVPGSKWDFCEVGVGGAGHKWVARDGGAFDDEWRLSMAPLPKRLLQDLANLTASREAQESEMDSGQGPAGTAAAEEEEEEEEVDDDEFQREVVEMFMRIIEGMSTEETAAIEINSLKIAYNRTFADCAEGILRALLELILRSPQTKQLLVTAQQVVATHAALLRRYLHSTDDEVSLLLAFEDFCSETHPAFAPVFALVVKILYDHDVVSEDGILQWALEKANADESDRVYVRNCQELIAWLQEAEEEDEDEEEDDESDG